MLISFVRHWSTYIEFLHDLGVHTAGYLQSEFERSSWYWGTDTFIKNFSSITFFQESIQPEPCLFRSSLQEFLQTSRKVIAHLEKSVTDLIEGVITVTVGSQRCLINHHCQQVQKAEPSIVILFLSSFWCFLWLILHLVMLLPPLSIYVY